MRVAYLVQTYRSLRQIARLVRTIKQLSPSAVIVISHNPEAFAIEPAQFADLADVHVLNAGKVNRGDSTINDAYLDAVAYLDRQRVSYDWLTNITGQCYPVRPLAEFEAMLASRGFDGYMDVFEAFVPGENNPWTRREAMHRYGNRFRWLSHKPLADRTRKVLSIPRRVINNVQPLFQLHTTYGLAIGMRGVPFPFSDRFRCYGGSHFKTLSRACVEYLVEFNAANPQFVDYLRQTLLPEEIYAQTVLINSGRFSFLHDNQHYISWSGGRLGRPRDLSAADLPSIFSQGAFFARKFDLEREPQAFDLIDERILGEARQTSEPQLQQQVA